MSFLKKLVGRPTEDAPENVERDGMIHPTEAEQVAAGDGGPETPTPSAGSGPIAWPRQESADFEADSKPPEDH